MIKIIFMFCLFITLGSSQLYSQEVNWTSFDELNEKMREEARPIMIFIQADWCKFCAMQENNTFTDKDIVIKLNSEYYNLKLNGEGENEIIFLNRTYRFKPSGAKTGTHELAEFLGKEDGKVTYPTTVVLSKFFQPVYRSSGFINSKTMNEVIEKTVSK